MIAIAASSCQWEASYGCEVAPAESAQAQIRCAPARAHSQLRPPGLRVLRRLSDRLAARAYLGAEDRSRLGHMRRVSGEVRQRRVAAPVPIKHRLGGQQWLTFCRTISS